MVSLHQCCACICIRNNNNAAPGQHYDNMRLGVNDKVVEGWIDHLTIIALHGCIHYCNSMLSLYMEDDFKLHPQRQITS